LRRRRPPPPPPLLLSLSPRSFSLSHMLHNKMSLLIAVFFNEAAEKGESVVLEVKNAICDFYSFPSVKLVWQINVSKAHPVPNIIYSIWL